VSPPFPIHPKIQFVSTEQAEQADVMVCMSWTDPPVLRDNLQAACGVCGHLVQHRPNAPVRPMKVCVSCAPSIIRQQ
jgi:hypothetical protein